jgi:hypothetical protein
MTAPAKDALLTEAMKRADILNASAAWGSDWDGHLLTSLVRRVGVLETGLKDALHCITLITERDGLLDDEMDYEARARKALGVDQ